MDILMSIRLMNAARFLLDGDKISQACEKSGFNDQRYFSQVFRRVFGCSPSEFKKAEHANRELHFHIILESMGKRVDRGSR